MSRVVRGIVALVLAVGALGAVRWMTPSPGPAFDGKLDAPRWGEPGPVVLVDNAHWNDGTAADRLVAFVGLLDADGYRVLPGANGTRAETLEGVGVSVVVNPLGAIGAVRRTADRVGLGGLAAFDDDALILQEIETTLQWIENGGSLLLVADESPLARGSQGLAERLGVRLRGRLVVDLGHSEAEHPSWLEFSRENGLVGAHAITDGAVGLPPVNEVVLLGGHALGSPPEASVLLRLSASATEIARAGDPPTSGRPVGGLAMAVAFERGRGRVVVLGDSHVLTSDPAVGPGLERPSTNNTRFVRAVMAWLSRADVARR